MAEGRIAGSRLADFLGAVTRHLIFAIPDNRDPGPENGLRRLSPGTILVNAKSTKLE